MLYVVRSVHIAIGLFFIGSIAYIYYTAFARIDNPLLTILTIALLIEGSILYLNRGVCPLTPLHNRYGDDKGFFGLFLPPEWVPWSSPVLAGVAFLGLILHLFIPAYPEAVQGRWDLQKYGCDRKVLRCLGGMQISPEGLYLPSPSLSNDQLDDTQRAAIENTPLHLYFRNDNLASVDGHLAEYRFHNDILIWSGREFMVRLPKNDRLQLETGPGYFSVYQRY